MVVDIVVNLSILYSKFCLFFQLTLLPSFTKYISDIWLVTPSLAFTLNKVKLAKYSNLRTRPDLTNSQGRIPFGTPVHLFCVIQGPALC